MSINHGRAGDESWRPPPPQAGRPAIYHAAPFRAVLAPTMGLRLRGEVPAQLWLALLTKSPDLDGLGWIELTGSAYDRQRVNLTAGGLQYMVNADDILFGCGAGDVTHFGIFDDAEQLCFYGAMLGATYSPFPPSEFRINAGSLKAKVL